MTSRGQCPRGGGVLVKNPVSAPGPPPPFKNPGSAPAITCAYNVAVCFGPRRMLNVGHGGVKYIVVVKGGPYYIHGV